VRPDKSCSGTEFREKSFVFGRCFALDVAFIGHNRNPIVVCKQLRCLVIAADGMRDALSNGDTCRWCEIVVGIVRVLLHSFVR